jgi:hypothetical protein
MEFPKGLDVGLSVNESSGAMPIFPSTTSDTSGVMYSFE